MGRRLLFLCAFGIYLGHAQMQGFATVHAQEPGQAAARAKTDGTQGPAGGHGHGAPLVHRFEHAEDWVKKFEGKERDAWQKPEAIVAALGDVQGKTVVDLGAGTGYFLSYLSRAVGDVGKVIALDIEADMVRYMLGRVAKNGYKNVAVRQVATDEPGLAAGTIDRVLIVDVWHHIPARSAYAKKLAAALAPAGAIFVVDFTLESKHGPPKAHRLKPADVAATLKDAGLAVEVLKTPLSEQYVVVGRRTL